MVFPDSEEYQVQLVKREEEAILVCQVQKGQLEKWENEVLKALQALQDPQERLVVLEMLANLEHLENLELLDQWESEDPLGLRACKDSLVHQASLACLA